MKRSKARPHLHVGQLKKLRLRANDILVVTTQRYITFNELDALRVYLGKCGARKMLFCHDDINLSIIRDSKPVPRANPVISQPAPERRR